MTNHSICMCFSDQLWKVAVRQQRVIRAKSYKMWWVMSNHLIEQTFMTRRRMSNHSIKLLFRTQFEEVVMKLEGKHTWTKHLMTKNCFSAQKAKRYCHCVNSKHHDSGITYRSICNPTIMMMLRPITQHGAMTIFNLFLLSARRSGVDIGKQATMRWPIIASQQVNVGKQAHILQTIQRASRT